MEWTTWSFLLYSIILSTLTFLLLRHLRRQNSNSGNHPPGPPGLPVFGHIFQLGKVLPHRFTAGLVKQYGQVIWLQLGSINTMVVLNAAAAAEIFKNHDQSFADRHVPAVLTSHGFHERSMFMAPYGARLRMLRRICTVELFSAKRISETEPIRRRCVDNMLTWIGREAGAPAARAVPVGRFAFLASFNIIGNLVISRDLADPESRDVSEFLSRLVEVAELTGKPNVADLFPWVGWIDPMGLRREMDSTLGKLLSLISGFVKERMEERRRRNGGGEGRRNKDFLDVLLDFEGSPERDGVAKLSEDQVTNFVLDMFMAGADTNSTTTEWAMAELFRHPKTMTELRSELANVVGPNRKMEESDIDHLPYLQAVVKETLRLHPPAPVLLPRKAIHDTEFMGYQVPKNTQVLINAWAIGRDPECWDDPLSFKPERFLCSKVEYSGQHFELLPFGSGRRICPGLTLGHQVTHLLLGSLLHEFEWELLEGAEKMDMRERMGLAVRKLEPLHAIPKKSLGRHSN